MYWSHGRCQSIHSFIDSLIDSLIHPLRWGCGQDTASAVCLSMQAERKTPCTMCCYPHSHTGTQATLHRLQRGYRGLQRATQAEQATLSATLEAVEGFLEGQEGSIGLLPPTRGSAKHSGSRIPSSCTPSSSLGRHPFVFPSPPSLFPLLRCSFSFSGLNHLRSHAATKSHALTHPTRRHRPPSRGIFPCTMPIVAMLPRPARPARYTVQYVTHACFTCHTGSLVCASHVNVDVDV